MIVPGITATVFIITHMYPHQIHLNVASPWQKYMGMHVHSARKNIHALPVKNNAEIKAFKQIKNNYQIQQ